jgi:hypothetical protein
MCVCVCVCIYIYIYIVNRQSPSCLSTDIIGPTEKRIRKEPIRHDYVNKVRVVAFR